LARTKGRLKFFSDDLFANLKVFIFYVSNLL